jgi:catechol 2,3-dioxygenase-like lactoylglutathione lyase family enzyme
LHRFVFSVPDLAAAVEFYDAFGLDVREAEGRADLYGGTPAALGIDPSAAGSNGSSM